MSWVSRISANPLDPVLIEEALDHFDKKYAQGMRELAPEGLLWDKAKMIPGMQAYWIGTWKELEAIVELYKIREKAAFTKAYDAYMVSYKSRALSDLQARKLAEAAPDVLTLMEVRLFFQLRSDQMAGLTTGLQSMHFQLTNLTTLSKENLEDAMF